MINCRETNLSLVFYGDLNSSHGGTGETQRGTVRIPPCQNFNIFPVGLQKPGSFWELKKKAGTDGYIYQTDVGLKGLYGRRVFLCMLLQSEKKKNPVEQLSSVMSLTATLDSLYLSSSLRAMCRESGFFPTETKFLPSDPHRHPPLLSSFHFRLSASQLWRETTRPQTSIIHHTQQQRPKKKEVKSSLDLCLWSYCTQHINPVLGCICW